MGDGGQGNKLMGNLEDVAEKIRRLQNERRNLIYMIEKTKKLADSEATALESEVSMLREKLRIEELQKPVYSKSAILESEVSMPHEELRIEELQKPVYSKTAALESEVSMLREAVRELSMDLALTDIRPNDPEETVDRKKKPWWHFFG